MAYATLRDKMGRLPVTVVELVLDYCANTYSVAPCTASGAAGSECYNCFANCQDTPNFNKTTKTYRFIDNIDGLPAGLTAIPALESISLAPTKIVPNGIGQRASVTVTFRDFPHHDRGIDPYVSTRSYDPTTQGSFFGKLKARNPYYINRKLIIRTGYIDQDNFDTTFLTDFQARTYFIERFEGPDTSGQVKIIAKDILKLADNDRAKAPVVSDGTLNSSITSSDTTLTLAIGYTTTYPSSGTIRINNEVITYSGKSGDSLTGLTRGENNTTASAHNASDSVQLCLVYSAQKPSDVLQDLLTNYASVDSSFIPSVDWTTENDSKLASNNITAVITEPTGVQDLIEEVLKSTLSYIWWDEIDQEIKFKVSFPVSPRDSLTTIDDNNNILDTSVTVKDDEKKRISEVIVYYNQHNPTENNDDKVNFSSIYAQIDTDAESVNKYGVKSTLEVISRWITSSGPAIEIAGRSLNLFSDTPRLIKFKLDAKDSDIKTGDIITITSSSIQDATGLSSSTNFLVTKRFERVQGTTYEYEALEFSLGSRVAYIGPDTLNDYTAETDDNIRLYGFISDNFGFMTNGDGGYKIA